jgi:hypothetical protein
MAFSKAGILFKIEERGNVVLVISGKKNPADDPLIHSA